MGALGWSGTVEPSRRAAPPAEFEDETLSGWLRRQSNPIKAKQRARSTSDRRRNEKGGE